MNTSSARLVVGVLAACVLVGCGAEERKRLESDVAAARAEVASLTSRIGVLENEASSASEARARLEADLAAARQTAESARAQTNALQAKASDAEALLAAAHETAKAAEEKAKKELDRVKSHRDELAEWIEKELLPIAEQHDPRLANLRDVAKDMAAEVEERRGLPFKKPFMRRLITREQVAEWMKRDLKKDMPEDEVRKMVTVGAEFGLLKPGTDIYAVFSQFLESGVAAFYRPDTSTFYHVEGNDGRGARPVVFHELVHAVEDQHFDLEAFARAVEEDSDQFFARRALTEGSASVFQGMYEKAFPEDKKAMDRAMANPALMQKQLQMLQTVPPLLIAALGLYPYKNGAAWLHEIGADEASEIEALFRDPPVSTEQVLHPAKFPLSGPRDYPHAVAAPELAPVLGEGWEKVEDNNMGELQTGVLLTQLGMGGQYMPTFMSLLDMRTQGVSIKGPAKTATEGWDGDRYSAWTEKGGEAVVIVWTSVWDSAEDAQQFYETYGNLLGKRVLGKAFSQRPEPVRYTDEATGRVSGLDLSGTRVVAVLGAPADKADALFAAGAAVAVTPDPRDPNDAN